MNKKGSHVGMIMSFVVFVTFVVFLYAILHPSITQEGKNEYSLNYLEKEIVKMASEDLTSATISITDNPIQLCVEFEGLITETGIDSKAFVKNELEENLLFYNSGSNLEVTRTGNSQTLFKVYQSNEFEDSNGESNPSCKNLELDNDYSIGLVRTKEYVFETKIISMINNYMGVKESLEDEIDQEFSFGFIYDDNTEISSPIEEISTSIFVEKIPVQYVDSQANIKSGFIIIRIWG